MKTYTAYSVVRGVVITLAFLTVGLPLLILFSSLIVVVGFGMSFFGEHSFMAFWDTFSCGLKGYCRDVKGVIENCEIFSFHA